MSTRTWDDGAADGNPLTAANWSADTAPIDGDTAILAQSSRSIIAVDQSSIELAALRILPGYGDVASGITIGSAVAPWQIDATELEINNKKCQYIKLAGAFPTVYARALGNATLYFGATAGDVGDVYAGDDGKIEVDTACKLLSFTSSGCGALIKGDTSSPDDLKLYIPAGCVVECQRRVAFAIVHGTLIMTGAAEGDAGSGTSEIHVQTGGLLDVRSTGNFDYIKAMPRSNVNGVNQIGGSSKVTVTTLVRCKGANVNLPTHLFNVTYINSGDEAGPG